MTKNQRARRIAKLCCNCTRNSAYYRAGWHNRQILVHEDFWVDANSNFLDIAVLEWCKLFTDKRGKHHWQKIAPNPDKFLPQLLAKIKVTENTFQDHCKEMKTYRDKFVAHLDDEQQMQIPKLTLAINSAIYLYDILQAEYAGVLGSTPKSLRSFYRERFAHAKLHYMQNQ